MRRLLEIFVLFLYALHYSEAFRASQVIYAVNSGGNHHVDCLGIEYDRDPQDNTTESSEWEEDATTKVSIPIRRVPKEDQVLHQAYRHGHNISYELPAMEDGDYVLVLKFSEVFYTSRNERVFDVFVNSIRIIEKLDIFDKVGNFSAHDEYIPLGIKNMSKTIVLNGSEYCNMNNRYELKFVQGKKGWPKINAIIVYKGNVNDFPKLRPLLEEEKPDHQRKRGCDCSRIFYERSYCYSDFSHCISIT